MKVWVLDLDGTLINPSKSSLIERDKILSYLESENDGPNLISEAEMYTLKHPLDFPWVYGGLPTAFVEDSYQWRSAQVKYLWQHLRTDKGQADFSYKMFLDATKDEEIELMESAKKFIEYLFDDRFQPVIVSNSATTKGQRCSQALQFIIPVYGNAKKYVVKKEHPFSIDGRESYSERPNYEQILNKIMSDSKTKPEDVFVVGDIFTLDLSLPYRLGMNCILIKNDLEDGFKTPKVFIEHARKLHIPVVSSLEDLIV